MPDEPPLRIRSIWVNNFKSLVDFSLKLAPFSCLIGLNGSGKSTVLQFMDFLSRLVRGDMEGWLEERQWQAADLRSKLVPKRSIDFRVWFTDHQDQPCGSWKATYSPALNCCTSERLDLADSLLVMDKNEIRVHSSGAHAVDFPGWNATVNFSFQGSVLSALKERRLPPSVLACKNFLQGFESLDMLTPERLRQRTRSANGTLGHGGRNLSAFLYEQGPDGLAALTKKLRRAYPRLDNLTVRSQRYGWKKLEATEQYGDESVTIDARHLNDGLLRLLAILAELSSGHSLLLFDEIENGINPELVEFLLDALVKARQQVLATTHSPVILNYLDDDTAKKSVIYLYRKPDGSSKAIRFFAIPSLKKKLSVMGPGEAFADTNLTDLAGEIAAMSGEE